MLTVTVGRTNKQINSTKQNVDDSVDLSCRLKEPTSMQSPVFIVQGLNKMTLYNFCKFENRYYYIDDIVYLTTDTQELHCHLDPLATFKDAIGNSYAYITYGPSGSKNVDVDDIRFGPDWKLNGFDVHDEIDIGINPVSSGWSVVMTAQASVSAVNSGICVYAFDATELSRILTGYADEIANEWSVLTNIVDIMTNLGAAVCSGGAIATDNIRSCVLVPISISKIKGSASRESTMYLGAYKWTVPSDLNVYSISAFKTIDKDGSFSLSRSGFGSVIPNGTYHWLNSPKYCSIEISHPCGVTEINDMALLSKNQVYWYSEVSPVTGDYNIRFTSEDGKDNDTIASIGGNLGIDIMNMIANGQGLGYAVMNSTVSIASGATAGYYKKTEATENKNLSAPAEDSNGDPSSKRVIDKGVKTKNTTEYGSSGISGNFNPGGLGPTMRGSAFNGGIVGLLNLYDCTVTVNVEYYYPGIFNPGASMASGYEAYCDLYGYPVNRYLKIDDTAGGYIECAGASVQGCLGANNANKATINSYMNNGFYYE